MMMIKCDLYADLSLFSEILLNARHSRVVATATCKCSLCFTCRPQDWCMEQYSNSYCHEGM